MIYAPTPVYKGAVATDQFVIPPGDSHHIVEASLTLNADCDLRALYPHMHNRGRSFEYIAVYPDGSKETLLRVPRYDFNWQLIYQLSEPKHLPRGTRIEATAVFDNSPGNPWNPDPKATVRWGDQTSEEMMVGFMELSFDAAISPRNLIGSRVTGRR